MRKLLLLSLFLLTHQSAKELLNKYLQLNKAKIAGKYFLLVMLTLAIQEGHHFATKTVKIFKK